MRLEMVVRKVSIGLVVAMGLMTPVIAWAGGQETLCADSKDDDGDGMVDCADADCSKSG